MTEETQSGWWWLSFADPERPEGERFLGAAIVFGPSFEGAVLLSRILRINPGGEVQGMGIVEGRVPAGPWRERLLSKAEALELKAWGDGRWPRDAGGKAT